MNTTSIKARYKASLEYDFVYEDYLTKKNKNKGFREGCSQIILSGNTIEEVMVEVAAQMMKYEKQKGVKPVRFSINIFVSD